VALVLLVRALLRAPFTPVAPAVALLAELVPLALASDWLPVVVLVALLSDWSPVVVVTLLLRDWSPVVVALSSESVERPRRSIWGLKAEVDPVIELSTVDVDPVTVEFVLETEPLTEGLDAFVLFVCAMAGPVAPSTAAAMTLRVKGMRFIDTSSSHEKNRHALFGMDDRPWGCVGSERTGCG
jgi:hypothetical protein